jgi:hypothetical protein
MATCRTRVMNSTVQQEDSSQSENAMDTLEAAGNSTEAQNVMWARQRDAVDLNAKKTLFRARVPRDGQARVRMERTVE